MVGGVGANLTQYPMALPLLWFVRHEGLKWSLITIFLALTVMAYSWLGYLCLGITLATIYWKSIAKMTWKQFAIGFSLVALLMNTHSQNNDPMRELSFRMEHMSVALDNWKDYWWGEGYNSYQKLPENKAVWSDFVGDYRWRKHAHSDVVQGFMELGAVRMIPIMILVLLPLFFIKPEPISAAYLCVLFQSFLDLPFHRWGTFFLAIIIIGIMYWRNVCGRLR